MNFCKVRIMEKHERLRAARSRRFKTAKDASDALGVPYGTYSGHEAGSRGFKDLEARQYASFFRVKLSWLLTGDGQMEPDTISAMTRVVPVMGRIGAGAEIEPDPERVSLAEGLFQIEIELNLPPGLIGFEIVGDSRYPRYDKGDVVVCARDGDPDALKDGTEAIVQTGDGRRFLKRIIRDDGKFTLESHNAAPIRNVELQWASPIIFTFRSLNIKKISNRTI